MQSPSYISVQLGTDRRLLYQNTHVGKASWDDRGSLSPWCGGTQRCSIQHFTPVSKQEERSLYYPCGKSVLFFKFPLCGRPFTWSLFFRCMATVTNYAWTSNWITCPLTRLSCPPTHPCSLPDVQRALVPRRLSRAECFTFHLPVLVLGRWTELFFQTIQTCCLQHVSLGDPNGLRDWLSCRTSHCSAGWRNCKVSKNYLTPPPLRKQSWDIKTGCRAAVSWFSGQRAGSTRPSPCGHHVKWDTGSQKKPNFISAEAHWTHFLKTCGGTRRSFHDSGNYFTVLSPIISLWARGNSLIPCNCHGRKLEATEHMCFSRSGSEEQACPFSFRESLLH